MFNQGFKRTPRLSCLKRVKKWKFWPQLRVFPKIFSILTVLLLFIALEGYLNLQNINQMQAITQKVFKQSNVSQDALIEAKQSCADLRRFVPIKFKHVHG
jgi:hypothetical protein